MSTYSKRQGIGAGHEAGTVRAWTAAAAGLLLSLVLLVVWMYRSTPPPQGSERGLPEPVRFVLPQ